MTFELKLFAISSHTRIFSLHAARAIRALAEMVGVFSICFQYIIACSERA